MKPQISPNLKTTFHRDGTVSYWDVFLQGWQRIPVGAVSDKVLSSLPPDERERLLLVRIRTYQTS